MRTYVVDASVAIQLFVPQIHSMHAHELFRHPEHVLVAPDLLLYEAGNVFAKLIRRGEIEASTAAEAMRRLRQSVSIEPAAYLADEALQLALTYGRSAYNALYIALAMELRCALVTADRRLYDAIAPALPEHLLWIEDIPPAQDDDQ